MKQPNPLVMLMGGGALINVGFIVYGTHAPAWVRYGVLGLCIAMGIASVIVAIVRVRTKKPEAKPYTPRRKRQVELLPEQRTKVSKKDESPPPPEAA